MIPQKPYLFLEDDRPNDQFRLHVAMQLENHEIIDEPPIRYSQPQHPHFNAERMVSGSVYERKFNLARIFLVVDDKAGHSQLWKKTYDIPYSSVGRFSGIVNEMIQVVVGDKSSVITHDGTSSAHLGDGD
ncbi:MAG: hypothetical protein HEP71_03315 [Roseivirga sp.]|nr:hypothetical protein [Roseivirga sp.]